MNVRALVMGMPSSIRILDPAADPADAQAVLDYWQRVDSIFSTYRPDSEMERLNRGELETADLSAEMQAVLSLCEQTKLETAGYFDIRRGNRRDPSGLVKGLAIWNAAEILSNRGFEHFYLEIGGDVEARGTDESGERWRVGIQNPFEPKQIIKAIHLSDQGVATSGTYRRGTHVYDPIQGETVTDPVSLTVVGPNVYDADRFATAAFAMGESGIRFIQSLPGFEGYMIRPNREAYYTPGFEAFVVAS